jgi:excisionase family DNA binding protein
MKTDLMTAAEVADLLAVSRPTVNRWVRVGKLHGIELPNGSYRIPRAEVDAILASTLTT